VVTGPKNPGPIPPVFTPGNFPGTKTFPGGGTKTYPGGTKTYPGGGPNNPDYPGSSRPPILTGTPNPGPIPPISGGAPPPVPIPSGSSPSPGYGAGTSYTQHGQVGVYADVGAGYAPCQWFKSNYDRTGNVYWLNRYRVCLWQH
jgi:Wiskott-Aldrich syndrome protein